MVITVASFGTWSSEITAAHVAKNTSTLEDVVVDALNQTVYHTENRPHEEGRSTIIKSLRNEDLINAPWDARTQAHEFGGGAVSVYNDRIFFTDYHSRRIYTVREGTTPTPITPDDPVYRYADICIYPPHPEYLVAVREDHSSGSIMSTETALIFLNVSAPSDGFLISDADFLSSPRFSPDGSKLAWIQWSHPHMPWDSCELFVSHVEVTGNRLVLDRTFRVFGGVGNISISQPRWLDKNHLVFMDDSSGFYNPKLCDLSEYRSPCVVSLLPNPLQEDFCVPDWYFGQSSYTVLTSSSILFSALVNGRSCFYLASISDDSYSPATFTVVDSPFVEIRSLHAVASDEVVFIGRTDTESDALISMKLLSSGIHWKALKPSSRAPGNSLISVSVPMQLHVSSDSDRLVHFFYYPPVNPRYQGPNEEQPPAILHLHGGPTFRQPAGFDWERQFFTSRGWAWVDINYTGSSGHGRKYRETLRGKWGIIEVQDCFKVATHLHASGHADVKRIVIRGPSAGGFTTLSALIAHPDTFAAGTSIYGGVDMLRLQLSGSVHKFTSHYYEGLIGGTVQNDPGLFQKRSPLFHANRIKTPLLVLQGSLDPVVPMGQAESLVQAIEVSGRRVEYQVFTGERHGWRKESTIREALEKELSFYRRVVLGLLDEVAEAGP